MKERIQSVSELLKCSKEKKVIFIKSTFNYCCTYTIDSYLGVPPAQCSWPMACSYLAFQDLTASYLHFSCLL